MMSRAKIGIPDFAQTLFKCAERIFMPYGHSPTHVKRVFKATLLTTVCFVLSCIDKVDAKLGTASYLCALISVSMHPGRRLGAMMQSLVFGLSGILIGVPYGLFFHFCARQTYNATNDLQKAYGIFIIGLFLVLAVFGYVRSVAPRFFPVVFIVFLICHFSFLLPMTFTYSDLAYDYSIPFIIGIGLSFVINVLVFPEFGSTYVGTTVLSAVHELQVMFCNTSYFFVTFDTDNPQNAQEHTRKLASLLAQKKKVRGALASCAATMVECTYELSYSFMAPQELKPLLKKLESLSTTTNALNVACELALGVFASYEPDEKNPEVLYTKLNNSSDSQDSFSVSSSSQLSSQDIIESIKPQKEASYANKELLVEFIRSVNEPVKQVTKVALDAMNHTKRVLAYAYDAPIQKFKFSNCVDSTFVDLDQDSMNSQYEVSLAKIDEYLCALAQVNESFSAIIKGELGKISDQEFDLVYLVPQEEYFVLSLFILNFRETTLLISQILSQVRTLLEVRQEREQKGFFGRKVWFSFLLMRENWSKYLRTGVSEVQEGETASIAATKQKERDMDTSENDLPRRRKKRFDNQSIAVVAKAWSLKGIRHSIVKLLDWSHEHRLHLQNSFRTVLVIFLVTFPGYSIHMRTWYNDVRGSWVGFAAIIALETNVGATGFGVYVRTICVIVCSAWGYALYAAGDNGDDRYVMSVMTFIGLIPLYYLMFYSPHGKSFLIGIVSLVVVPLSTLRNHGIPGTILINFGKRCIAMLIGGSAAMIINVAIFPQKSRVQLVSQIIIALKSCQLIQIQLALGLNGELPSTVSMVRNEALYIKYQKRAKLSLAAAECLLAVAKTEPRLKGSFRTHAEIYTEIIFVLHQILDRYQNIKFLRQQYGSAVLEELSPYTYLYRREVYATIVSLLRTTEEALFTKKCIPQYMPSPRIAHIRVVNAVREQLVERRIEKMDRQQGITFRAKNLQKEAVQNEMLGNKYMGWSATSVATEEVIQYVEELASLAKFLVGSQEFEFGFLARPLYEERSRLIRQNFRKNVAKKNDDGDDDTAAASEGSVILGNATVESPPGPGNPEIAELGPLVYKHSNLSASFVYGDDVDHDSLVRKQQQASAGQIQAQTSPPQQHSQAQIGYGLVTPGFGMTSDSSSSSLIPIPDGGVLAKQATLEFPKEVKRRHLNIPSIFGSSGHSHPAPTAVPSVSDSAAISIAGPREKAPASVSSPAPATIPVPLTIPAPTPALGLPAASTTGPSIARITTSGSVESSRAPRRRAASFFSESVAESEEELPLTLQKITTRNSRRYSRSGR